MSKSRMLTLALLATAAVAAVVGCNSSSPTNPGGGSTNSLNQAQAQSLVSTDESADPNLAGLMDDNETVEAAPSRGGIGGASPYALIPDSVNLCWFRHLRHTTLNIVASGDSANMTVTLTRTNQGILVGEECGNHGHGHSRGDEGENPAVAYRKPFQTTWHRSAVLAKLAVADTAEDEDDHEEGTRWVLKTTSLAYSVQDSPSVPTPQILSVTVSGQDSAGNPVSVTFTDPTVQFDPTILPKFAQGDSVQVKVVTDSPTTEMAFIHFDQGIFDAMKAWRRPLAYNAGDNAFEGSFRVRPGHGMGHFRNRRVRDAVWVDVLNKDTIRDDTAPYASEGWGLPYRLRAGGGHGMDGSVALRSR